MFLLNFKNNNSFGNRNFGLDVMRSAAIILVLISHSGIDETKTYGLKIGGIGVEIFFVLSGFLIGQIIIRDLTIEINFRKIVQFWIRRWFRTIPLYYLVLLLKFIIIDHTLGFKVLVYFFFLQNNFVGIDFMPVSWSLVIEEWFYLFLPLFLWLLSKVVVLRGDKLFAVIIASIFTVIIARLLFVFLTDRSYNAIAGNFPFRIDSMMLGVLAAAVKIRHGNIFNAIARPNVAASVFVFYLGMLFLFAKSNSGTSKVDDVFWTRTVWFSANSLCIAMLIPFLHNIGKRMQKRNTLWFFITSISVYSYGAYLFHAEVFHFIYESPVYSGGWIFETLVAWLLTFGISGIMYFVYEKPFTDLREKFSQR